MLCAPAHISRLCRNHPHIYIYKAEGIINSWFPEEIQQHSPGLGSKPLSQGSRCRAMWSCSTALQWTEPWGSANSTFGFCTQKTLCAQMLLSNPAPVQQGQTPPRRDLLPLPMEGNRAELGFLSHGHNRHVLNGVH